MNKIIIIITLLMTANIYAANVSTPASSVVIPQRFEKCLKWKRVCQKKNNCQQRDLIRKGCYLCTKPVHYGFRAYHNQIQRQSCNIATIDYLRNMGYNCYHSAAPQRCTLSTEKKWCDWTCVEFAKR